MIDAPHKSPPPSPATWVRFGYAITAAAIAAITISAALIVPMPQSLSGEGAFVVEAPTATIAAAFDGRVAHVLVRNGDFVAAHQTIMTMEDGDSAAELVRLDRKLAGLGIQQARLNAEIAMRGAFDAPPDFDASDETQAANLAAQRLIFDERRAARSDREASLTKRLEDLDAELAGVNSQLASRTKDREANERDLANAVPSVDRGAGNPQRVGELQRSSIRIGGDLTKLRTEVARLKAARGEVEAQISELAEQDRRRSEADLAKLQALVDEISREKRRIEDRRAGLDVKAPIAGFVQALTPATAGSAIAAGATIADIVPESEDLLVSAVLPEGAAAELAAGQFASLRLSSGLPFGGETLNGRIRSLTPDSGGTVQALIEARRRSDTSRTATAPGAKVRLSIGLPPRAVIPGALAPFRTAESISPQ